MPDHNITEWLIRLSSKLDEMKKDTREIKVTLGKQEVHLQNHIKRTDLLEDSFKPVQKTVLQLEGIGKFLAVLGVSSIILYMIAKFF